MRISDWSSDVCSSDHRRLNRDPNLTQIERVSVDLLSRDRIDRRRPSFPTHLSSGTKQSKALPEDALRMLARAVIANDKDLDRKSGRVGKECVIPCRSRWSPYHYKKHISNIFIIIKYNYFFLQAEDGIRDAH